LFVLAFNSSQLGLVPHPFTVYLRLRGVYQNFL